MLVVDDFAIAPIGARERSDLLELTPLPPPRVITLSKIYRFVSIRV